MVELETVDSLLSLCRREGESRVAWCRRRRFPLRTLERMLAGGVPRHGTALMLAKAMPEIGDALERRVARIARACGLEVSA